MPLQDYTCTPTPRTRRAYLYVLACVLAAVAVWFATAMWKLPYPLVWHCAAMFLLTGALLVTVRYLVKRYVYRITETDDGDFDFVVLEISGKRTVCVCRVSVDCFRAFAPVEKNKRVETTYNWCVEPHAAGYLLTLVDGEEQVTVRFSPDAVMAAMIETVLRSMPR